MTYREMSLASVVCDSRQNQQVQQVCNYPLCKLHSTVLPVFNRSLLCPLPKAHNVSLLTKRTVEVPESLSFFVYFTFTFHAGFFFEVNLLFIIGVLWRVSRRTSMKCSAGQNTGLHRERTRQLNSVTCYFVQQSRSQPIVACSLHSSINLLEPHSL